MEYCWRCCKSRAKGVFIWLKVMLPFPSGYEYILSANDPHILDKRATFMTAAALYLFVVKKCMSPAPRCIPVLFPFSFRARSGVNLCLTVKLVSRRIEEQDSRACPVIISCCFAVAVV